MSFISTRAAARSNYAGMVALVDTQDRVYLGKKENYHFEPSTENEPKAYYDNSDGTLEFISYNVAMFHLLSTTEFTITQRQLRRERGFSKADYIEFASLRDGVLSKYTAVQEVTFAGQPFVPPKAYNRSRRHAHSRDCQYH